MQSRKRPRRASSTGRRRPTDSPRSAGNGRRRSWPRRLLRWLLLAIAAWLLLTVSVVAVLRFVDPPISSFMVRYWLEVRSEGKATVPLQRQWRPLEQIAPVMRLAVVASEDQKFPQHRGFDVDALRTLARQHLAGEGGRGGSTISQQTAKNLFLSPSRSWLRKGVEAYFTVLIERLWPKRRVLEVYLNIVEFGPGIYGVEAAAQAYFGRSASALTDAQAARLAAVLPSPRRYRVEPPSAQVLRRADWILAQMRALGGPAYLAGIDAN